jgi:hypothetical protein
MMGIRLRFHVHGFDAVRRQPHEGNHYRSAEHLLKAVHNVFIKFPTSICYAACHPSNAANDLFSSLLEMNPYRTGGIPYISSQRLFEHSGDCRECVLPVPCLLVCFLLSDSQWCM